MLKRWVLTGRNTEDLQQDLRHFLCFERPFHTLQSQCYSDVLCGEHCCTCLFPLCDLLSKSSCNTSEGKKERRKTLTASSTATLKPPCSDQLTAAHPTGSFPCGATAEDGRCKTCVTRRERSRPHKESLLVHINRVWLSRRLSLCY